ncbi:hypothetical protein ACFP81_10120 [Deinococcus lacus]|uniref:Translocation/assembly module TamB n=1 Tax=Deinococcus lacus TaxID=392561 RepID=A0ABW1YFH6_9DEIO
MQWQQGALQVTGRQAVTALGRSGQVQGSASWTPQWGGQVNLSGTLDGYALAVRGPWDRLSLSLQAPGSLRAAGTASVPQGRYDLSVSGELPGGPGVQGRVYGRGADPYGRLDLTSAGGGRGQLTLRGLNNIQLEAQRLELGGQVLSGALSTRGGLTGQFQAGGLTVRAKQGALEAAGEWAGHSVQARGRLRLPAVTGAGLGGPATLDGLKVQVSGPYVSGWAQGSAQALRGRLTVRAQRWEAGDTALILPAQTLAVTASLQPPRVEAGGLVYAAGRWSGAADLRYTVAAGRERRLGQVRLAGNAAGLQVGVSGPVRGQLAVWPRLQGNLRTSAQVLTGLLPASAAAHWEAGELTAQLSGTGADLSLRDSRWLGRPLGLEAHLDWAAQTLEGRLTHQQTRLPLSYRAGTLRVRRGQLDAASLRPWLSASGLAQGELTWRNVLEADPADLQARLDLNLRPLGASGDAASGQVVWQAGQLRADLTGAWRGTPLRVQGPLYPVAGATLRYGDLSGRLSGDARQTLTLGVSGRFQGRPTDIEARLSGVLTDYRRAELSGTLAGTLLNAQVQATGPDWKQWTASGRFSSADLSPFGVQGHASGAVSGRLGDLRGQVAGRVEEVDFSAPVRWSRRLTVQSAELTSRRRDLAGQARLSGELWPRLSLTGPVELQGTLAGQYQATLGGRLERPDLTLSGTWAGADTGQLRDWTLDPAQVQAHLLGSDWAVRLSGNSVAGTLRGQLGTSSAPGGLLTADLQLRTRYQALRGQERQDVALSGPLGWNARQGWSGDLWASGTLSGQALSARFQGQGGDLLGSGTLGSGAAQGRFSARLPAEALLRPAGEVALQGLDIGALWGRPGQLGLTGSGSLSGQEWQQAALALAGRLEDAGGDLSGDFGLDYQVGGGAALRLAGERLSGGGTWDAQGFQARLQAEDVRLARLLPPEWAVDSLVLRGRLQARGSAQGLSELSAEGLDIRGQQRRLGPFTLTGRAAYQPQAAVSSTLAATLGRGRVTASGSLPQGLEVRAQGIDLAALGLDASLGTLSGAATLTGPPEAASVAGHFVADGQPAAAPPGAPAPRPA